MTECIFSVRVEADRTTVRVLARAPVDGGAVVWSDDRRYAVPAPVVVQLLCAVVLALSRPDTAAQIAQALCEDTSALW